MESPRYNRGMPDGFFTDLGMLGSQIAMLDDIAQAAFFKGMTKEMNTWGHYQAEMQLHHVNARLSPAEKELLSCLGMEDKK
jgi:hypothetical protein